MSASRRVSGALASLAARLLPKFVFSKSNFEVWQRAGWHVVPNHFYEPVPDTRRLPESLWDWRSRTFAFDFNAAAQEALLEGLKPLLPELTRLLDAENPMDGKALRAASSFGSGDREILYALVRRLKPACVLEIGSGATTAISASALEKNREEGRPGELIAVEPFPAERLVRGFPGLTRLERAFAQDLSAERIAALKAGDILFIDSSHVLKAGSDVQYIFSTLLPAVPSGVYVHFHDIFLPSDYPRSMYDTHRLFWNEQYALELFLSFNTEFEVVWGGAFMSLSRPEKLREAIPWMEPLPHRPGSFWIRRR